eukprot:1192783-Prorocentrum_minimum.AAC.1
MNTAFYTTRQHLRELKVRGDQSTERKEFIPGGGTNQSRGKSIYSPARGAHPAPSFVGEIAPLFFLLNLPSPRARHVPDLASKRTEPSFWESQTSLLSVTGAMRQTGLYPLYARGFTLTVHLDSQYTKSLLGISFEGNLDALGGS